MEVRIGTADDYADADGVDVLSYPQAAHRAMDLGRKATQKRAGLLATVDEAVADYIEWMRLHRKTAGDTQVKLAAYVVGEGSPLRGRRLDSLTDKDFDGWLKWALQRQSKRAPKAERSTKRKGRGEGTLDAKELLRRRKVTLNRVVASLKAVLNRAKEQGHIASDDAWRGLKKFRGVDSARVRWLSEDEAQRLRSAAPDDLRVLIDVALMTGMRLAEIMQLTAADFEARSETVLVSESKSGKPRRIPLTTPGADLFRALAAGKQTGDSLFSQASGKPWNRHAVSRGMRQACAEANIQPVDFHGLRHTFASHLVGAGTPLAYVAQVLGHRDTRMTEKHYGHLAPSHVADTIRGNLPTFGVTAPSSVVTDIRDRKATA